MPNLLSEKFEPIIGLEIHIELKTRSKMFCNCLANHFGKKPNTQICPVCLGLPGALPVANQKAIEWTVLVGLALNCQIPVFSKFDRKNYFYPDLPKGYQISQYDLPLCKDGRLDGVKIRRVHLEEDTAKLTHTTVGGKKYTLIDFNRSGVPLMEIVTDPDITSALQAKTFLKKLQQIVRYLRVSEANMEKGQMRCEPTVNLKIIKDGEVHFTPLVEIKNINSFKFVQKAIEFEINRQSKEFRKTGIEKSPGNKSTRGWDEVKQETVLQREKEEAADYRYFPEPDLPPIRWRKSDISNWKLVISNLELPEKKIERFMKDYRLSEYNATILAETREKAEYFEKAFRQAQGKLESTTIANWIINKRIDIKRILPEKLVEMMIKKKVKPSISEEQLRKVVRQVLETEVRAVEDYRKGKTNAIEFLIGQVIALTKGKANPNQTRKLLLEKLD
jgi:aspartyl-tRNA(Asn)/glutamyl-tRNA(Gln) amidotransferase subunit B